MKKLILLIAITLASVYGFGQASAGYVLRIADTTAATLQQNVPVGTLVYVTGINRLFVCKSAAATTDKVLTGSSGKFSMVTKNTAATIAAGIGVSWTKDQTELVIDTANVNWITRTRATNTFLPKAIGGDGQMWIGDGAYKAGNYAMSQDATMTKTGVVTVKSATGNMYVRDSLTIHSTRQGFVGVDSVLVVKNGVVRKIAPNAFVQSSAVKTLRNETFEKATDSTFYVIRLANVPDTNSMSVSVNGMEILRTKWYVQASTPPLSKVRIAMPQYTWDKISIQYAY